MPTPLIELRVEILRHWRRPLYYLAAEINVHPCRLSGMLHKRVPMPAAVRHRIMAVLADAEKARHGR